MLLTLLLYKTENMYVSVNVSSNQFLKNKGKRDSDFNFQCVNNKSKKQTCFIFYTTRHFYGRHKPNDQMKQLQLM